MDLGAIRVVAVVRRQPAGWALDLTFVSPSGQARETLLAARCETLVKVVALKVALAVDPTALVDFVEEPRPTPKAPVSPPEGRRPQLRPEQVDVSPAVPGWGIRLAGGAAFGPLPGVAPAVSLMGSVRLHGVRFELGGNYRFARTTHYEDLPSVGGRFDLLSATARVCPTAVLGRFQVPLCAGLEAGALRGAGFGVPEATTSTRPWVAVLLGPALVIPVLDSVDVWVEVDAMLGLWRPGFRMRNLGRLYKPESGSAQGWVGLELRFD